MINFIYLLLYLADHLESIGIHEEKRKSIKGIQNGINPSDQNTQTLVKEVRKKKETHKL